MKPRAVIDTSALIDLDRHELVFTARQGYFKIVLSPFIIAEFVRIRTELAIEHGQDREIYRARINAAVHELSALASHVDYTRLRGGNYTHWLKDPDDEPILATALVGKAQYVISHNTKHFPPGGSFAGVRYLTPRQFLDHLNSQHPERNTLEDWESSGFRLP